MRGRRELDTMPATVGDTSHGLSPVTDQWARHHQFDVPTHTHTGVAINILHLTGSTLPIIL